jgi:hypothetical protein
VPPNDEEQRVRDPGDGSARESGKHRWWLTEEEVRPMVGVGQQSGLKTVSREALLGMSMGAAEATGSGQRSVPCGTACPSVRPIGAEWR